MQNESTRLRDIEIQSKASYLLKTEVIIRNSRWKIIERKKLFKIFIWNYLQILEIYGIIFIVEKIEMNLNAFA